MLLLFTSIVLYFLKRSHFFMRYPVCYAEVRCVVCEVDSYDISFLESILTAFGSILVYLIKVGIVHCSD